MRAFWDAMEQYVAELFGGLSLKASCLVFLAAVSSALELDSPARRALVYLMLADYALGAAHALKDGTYNWPRFAKGVSKFAVYGFAIIITRQTDIGLGIYGQVASFTSVLCGLMCVNESISALTHLGEFGLKIPGLTERLTAYRESIMHPQRRLADRENTSEEHDK